MVRKMRVVSAASAVALLFGIGTFAAQANDVYIAQAATGSANGSSCANAFAYGYFNTGSNWTSSVASGTQIGPGSTVHICGTISVGVNTEALVFQGSGTAAAPVTLYFESGAVLSSPEWPAQSSGGAIDTSNQNYIVVNGNGGANGATQGVIVATSTGDTGAACPSGSCTYHSDSNGIETDNSNYLTIEGLTIEDMYVAINGVPDGGGGACMWGHGTSTNWTITNNTFHDMSWCVNLQYEGTSSNITVSNNQIYNIDHGIAFGSGHSGTTLENVNVYGNNIHDYANWDTGAADVWHHDGIHIWGYNDDGSDTVTGVNIYNNKFGGCIGQNPTAHVFIEQNAGNTKNVAIFNNTLIDACNGTDNDGMLTTGVDGGYKIYNNTFIGSSNDICVGTSSSPDVTFTNNVVSGCGIMQYVTSGGSYASGGLKNNIYANCTSSNCFAFPGGYTTAFSAWQSYTGQDASPSAYVASANISAAGVPQAGSPVIGAGTNLASLTLNSLANALNTDILGNPRPLTGAWAAGAYATTGTGPQPPTNLTGTIVTN